MTARPATWLYRLGDCWWTLAAPGYDRAVSLVGWHRWLDALVADVTSGPLLDIGCGPAYLALGLMARGIGYVGVDRNAAMVARARRRIASSPGRGLVLHADVTALPFHEKSFDIVVAAAVLGLLDLHSRQAALREIARVTRREIRLLEPVRRVGAPSRSLRAHVLGLVRERPLELTELAEAGLVPEVRGHALLAGVYAKVHAVPRLRGLGGSGRDGFFAVGIVNLGERSACPGLPAHGQVAAAHRLTKR